MNTVRIANLKSIRDSGIIELKPITILVGKNSSGKSSFLRLFSLLRQSVEVRTRSPFLWYGQYVDFGSFKEAIRHDADPQQIVFDFSFNLTDDLIQEASPRNWYHRHIVKRLSSLKDVNIGVELTLAWSEDKAFFCNIAFTVGSDVVVLTLDETDNVTKFLVNGLDIISLTGEYDILGPGKIIPLIKTKQISELTEKRRDYFSYVYGGIDEATQAALVRATSILFHGNTSKSTRLKIVNNIVVEPPSTILQNLRNVSTGGAYQTNLNYYAGDELIGKLRNLTIASVVPGLLLIADEELTRVARNVRSIAPIRATAERYYRKQDLAIDEVDYKGQNLAMYLGGLNSYEMKTFREWTIKNLNFAVSVEDTAGHLELFLTEEEGMNKYNLADSGFGFSQILPIVAQLWSMLNPTARTYRQGFSTNIFTIEQPELHLHPSLQAKVADLLIAAVMSAAEKNFKMRLIVETHSEAIVNRIGNQIAKGKLSSQDVNIVMFEKRGPNDSTEISVASYDNDGLLLNWPYGFFDAE